MELQRQRQYLTLATVCLLVLSAGMVYWSVSAIDESGFVLPRVQPSPTTGSNTTGKTEFKITTTMTQRKLRAPLYDPEPAPPVSTKPVVPAAPRPKPEPKLNLTLVGTIIESDKSLAIIADANGQFDVKGVGDTLEIDPDGIAITNIKSEQVTLTYRGKSTVLMLERKQKKNKDPSGNRNKNRKRSLR